jgi:MFS transporter, ACS family, glucarate transporter
LSARLRDQRAVISLVAARIVYAINWLNIGAIFYLMNADLKSGVGGLGALTSSFYLGVGVMQVPGGVLAAKWGPKRTVSLGMLVSSLAVLGTSVSSAIVQVAILRFIVGAGMALVFAPLVVLMTRLLGGKSGTGVGLINSAFDVGGLFGLFGWILLASITGWRSSLVLSGGLGVLTALLVIALVPKDEENLLFRFSEGKLVRILRDRNLIVLGLGSLGSNLGSVLISSFTAYYLQSNLGESAAIAGLVAAMIVVLPIYTSLWGGRLYDRSRKPRRLLIMSGLGMTTALFVTAAPSLSAAATGAVLGGIVVGPASTINFAAAKDLSRVGREYEGLTIGWVNSISLTGSFWPPLIFSYFARSFNYSYAWVAGAAMCFLLLVPLFFLRDDHRSVPR